MNSYELDQPLDLRLKALNLSRGFHHDAPLQHHIQPPHNMVMVTNMMMSSYGTNTNSCSNLLLTNYYNQSPNYANQPTHQPQQQPQQQQQQDEQHHQHQHQQCNDSPLALTTDPATATITITTSNSSNILNPPPAYMSQNRLANPFGSPSQASVVDTSNQPAILHHQHQHQHQHAQQQNNTAAHEQVGQHNQLRSDHIHCQPLNHHQPHPLSRLHPSPPNMNHVLSSPPAPSHAMQLNSQPPAQAAQQQQQPPPPPPPPRQQPVAPLGSGGGATYGPGISSSAGSSDTVSSLSPICQNQHPLLHHHPHPHLHHQHHTHNQQRQNQAAIASSLQNLAHQNSAIKHRQYSPPILEHQHHHQHAYQPVLPVRSLSMSGQMLTPSHLSLMVSPTSTPPTSTAAQSASCSSSSSSSSSSCSGNLQHHNHRMPPGNSTSPSARASNESVKSNNQGPLSRHNTGSSASPGELTSPFSSSSKSASSATSTSCNNNTNKGQSSCSTNQQSSAPIPTPNTGRKGSANSSITPPTGSPNFSDTAGGDGSASPPIMRQHSLVSRHSCKPCGIAFSQPETLRAHQEGYCTKTNRNQLRSQSAVSPSAIQQTACANNNGNSNKK